jgi:hypothetical protein
MGTATTDTTAEGGVTEMADVKRFSEQVIEYAERLGNMADAAEGKEPGKAPRARWLILPAAGAGLYALTTSGAFSRQAREVAKDAKERAAELPEALFSRVQQATSNGSASDGRQSSRSTRSASRGKSATTRSKS